MRRHTTHHDDCGCLSARYEAQLEAERTARLAAEVRATAAELALSVEKKRVSDLENLLGKVDGWWSEKWDCSRTPGHDGYPGTEIYTALRGREWK